MTISRVQSTILWGGATSKVVTSATEVVSDAFVLPGNAIALSIQFSVTTSGTPASGDTALFKARWSADGTLFDTPKGGQPLSLCDTYTTNGENPMVRTIGIDQFTANFKVTVACPQAATRNVTIVVKVEYQLA